MAASAAAAVVRCGGEGVVLSSSRRRLLARSAATLNDSCLVAWVVQAPCAISERVDSNRPDTGGIRDSAECFVTLRSIMLYKDREQGRVEYSLSLS